MAGCWAISGGNSDFQPGKTNRSKTSSMTHSGSTKSQQSSKSTMSSACFIYNSTVRLEQQIKASAPICGKDRFHWRLELESVDRTCQRCWPKFSCDIPRFVSTVKVTDGSWRHSVYLGKVARIEAGKFSLPCQRDRSDRGYCSTSISFLSFETIDFKLLTCAS